MIDCFDSDVLIYAADLGHPLGRRVRRVIERADSHLAGSVMVLPEVFSKPMRDGRARELAELTELLSRVVLHPVDHTLADLATSLGAKYRLRAPDAIHLATAVSLEADRFITNNRRDFDKGIAEVDVVFPEALPEPG